MKERLSADMGPHFFRSRFPKLTLSPNGEPMDRPRRYEGDMEDDFLEEKGLAAVAGPADCEAACNCKASTDPCISPPMLSLPPSFCNRASLPDYSEHKSSPCMAYAWGAEASVYQTPLFARTEGC